MVALLSALMTHRTLYAEQNYKDLEDKYSRLKEQLDTVEKEKKKVQMQLEEKTKNVQSLTVRFAFYSDCRARTRR